MIRGTAALASLLRLRAGRFVVATDRGQDQTDLRGSLASQLAALVPALRSGAPLRNEGPVYVTLPPPAVLSVIDELTEPMPAPVMSEPMVVTVRLPPVRLPPAQRPAVMQFAPPMFAPPPPVQPQAAPYAGPYASFTPVERTLPLPRPSAPARASASRVASVKKRVFSREAWMKAGAVAAVVAVAVSGLAVGVGLRVFQGADANNAPAAR